MYCLVKMSVLFNPSCVLILFNLEDWISQTLTFIQFTHTHTRHTHSDTHTHHTHTVTHTHIYHTHTHHTHKHTQSPSQTKIIFAPNSLESGKENSAITLTENAAEVSCIHRDADRDVAQLAEHQIWTGALLMQDWLTGVAGDFFSQSTVSTGPLMVFIQPPRVNALKEEALDGLPWKDKRESHCQSDKHWNIKGNTGETSERQGGAHRGFSEHRYHLELNRTLCVISHMLCYLRACQKSQHWQPNHWMDVRKHCTCYLNPQRWRVTAQEAWQLKTSHTGKSSPEKWVCHRH